MKLEDIARESRNTYNGDKSGVPIVGLEHLIPQEIKFSDYDVDTENTFTKTFKKGQILFGRRRAYLKKAAIADFNGICSGDITVIEAIPDKVEPMLLPFIIQNDRFFDYAVSRSAGGLSPRVKWEHLKDYEFSLPPLAEQKILANKLWSAYRLKESYKRLLTATQEMVKSRFIEMCSEKGYASLTLDDLATEWLKGQPFKKSSLSNHGKNKCIHYGELFTKYGQIIDNVLSTCDDNIIKSSKSGDILFPASDVTPDGLARCSALMKDNILLGGDIIILRPKKNICPEYLSWAIYMQKDQLLRRVTGSVVRHMSTKGLKTIKVPVAPIYIQKKFISIVRQSDKSEFEIKKSIEAIEAVIKSLINS